MSSATLRALANRSSRERRKIFASLIYNQRVHPKQMQLSSKENVDRFTFPMSVYRFTLVDCTVKALRTKGYAKLARRNDTIHMRLPEGATICALPQQADWLFPRASLFAVRSSRCC